MIRRLHVAAALTAFLAILTFWLSTVSIELLGTESQIALIKEAIAFGLFLLVPALAVAGATGAYMGRGTTDQRILAKKHRMPFIAGNGILILVPAVIYLDRLASRGDFGTTFVTVQSIELVAGLVNLALMSLNIRDGMRLAGHAGA
ncbi:MAG: hypothetical protein GEU93_08900 [Propionibacteriales bacterium]|nr:hypothetical protein [Propionibacteriales bacterium]